MFYYYFIPFLFVPYLIKHTVMSGICTHMFHFECQGVFHPFCFKMISIKSLTHRKNPGSSADDIFVNHVWASVAMATHN